MCNFKGQPTKPKEKKARLRLGPKSKTAAHWVLSDWSCWPQRRSFCSNEDLPTANKFQKMPQTVSPYVCLFEGTPLFVLLAAIKGKPTGTRLFLRGGLSKKDNPYQLGQTRHATSACQMIIATLDLQLGPDLSSRERLPNEVLGVWVQKSGPPLILCPKDSDNADHLLGS